MSSSIGPSMLSRGPESRVVEEPRELRLTDPREAQPVDRGGAQTAERSAMHGRAVPLVVREVERGVSAMQAAHDAIARDLRHDRRRGDARRDHVALLHTERGTRHLADREPVREDVVGRWLERADASAQQRQVAPMEPAGVEHAGLDLADDEQARGDDPFALLLALLRGQELRVAEAGAIETLGEDDGGRHQRTRECAAPDLVHPGDPPEPVGTQRRLVSIQVLVYSHPHRLYSHPHRLGGHTITNAFPITLSTGTYPTPCGGGNRESPECARLSPNTKSLPSGTVTGGNDRSSRCGSR